MSNRFRWIFGDVTFQQSEEFEEFRFKLLSVLMLLAALFTALFVAGEMFKVNRIDTPHFLTMQWFTATTLALWWALRGRKHWFKRVAWTYEIVCLVEYTSSLWFVPADELRLLWFFVNVPGVFILLGSHAGWLITGFTVVWLFISNALMPSAYSGNAMATFTVGILYLAAFFHAYGARSMSYFKRMRDYNEALERMASHDMLTGVLNARAYYAACEKAIVAAGRSGNPYAVLFIDLDHFKSINDTHGHSAGDAVLKAVATCMQQSIRRSDLLGRVGGEEFSAFMPDIDQAGALLLAESLRRSIEALNPSIGSGTLKVTASIGVAAGASGTETIHAIQGHADEAMYHAKKQGRNRVSAIAAPLNAQA